MAASLWRHRRHDRKACLPAPFKSCHVRATVRNADVDEGNRKTADFTCFFFLRENRRSASKGFFLAWLNSGKKQTRLTTRLVVFSAFSAWRHENGFVADYDAIDKPRERRLRSHAKKKLNLLTRNVEVFVYLWSVKSWALTICMENPEILWRIQMELFIPVEIFRKKRNTFRGITFFSFLQKRPKFFCTICLDY